MRTSINLIAAGWDSASPAERMPVLEAAGLTFTCKPLSVMCWDDVPELVKEYVIPIW